MNALLLLIPLSLALFSVALAAFFWAVDAGQFDDLDSPAFRPLEDEPKAAACEPAVEKDR